MEFSRNAGDRRNGERPESGDANRATHELVQRIVKLRWMGLDDEAEQIRSTLQNAEPGVTWLTGPCDTD